MIESTHVVSQSVTIRLDLLILKGEDKLIAYCPALELSTRIQNEEDMQDTVDQYVRVFLEEMERNGSLEKYLLKHGWTLSQHPEIQYIPPPPVPADETYKGLHEISRTKYAATFPVG